MSRVIVIQLTEEEAMQVAVSLTQTSLRAFATAREPWRMSTVRDIFAELGNRLGTVAEQIFKELDNGGEREAEGTRSSPDERHTSNSG